MSDTTQQPGKQMIPTNRPYFTLEDRQYILAELDTILAGGKLTMGPWIDLLEQVVAKKTGAAHVVATNSGTGALEILCRRFGLTASDEVIVPTNTFVATANAVRLAGGTPVLADIGQDTLALTPATVRNAISKRTKGVITVHIAGLVAPDFGELRALCRSRGIFLLEDAAHAFGAAIPEGKVGTLADGAAFSLFPTKPVTAGEGGLLCTNDDGCAEFARSYRCHGIDTSLRAHRFIRLGHNFRMSEITALIGLTSIRRIDEAQKLRDRVARYYNERFAESDCSLPRSYSGGITAWFKYPLLLPEGWDGDLFRTLCAERGVACTSCYWPPVHRQPYYASTVAPEQFPVAEAVLRRTVALPVFPELSTDQMRHVADTVIGLLTKAGTP